MFIELSRVGGKRDTETNQALVSMGLMDEWGD